MKTWIVTTYEGNQTTVQADSWKTSDGMLLLERISVRGDAVVALFAAGKWISCVAQS